MLNGQSGASLREELGTLLTALWHEIDYHGGTRASRYFTPDAELRFENASFHGTSAIDGVYRDRASRGARLSRHLVTNLHLLEIEADRVRVVSALLMFAEDGEPPRPKTTPTLVADVWDEFELRDGQWLISSRWIKNLFLGSPTELAVPME